MPMLQAKNTGRSGHLIRLLLLVAIAMLLSAICYWQRESINKDAPDYIYCARCIEEGNLSQAMLYRPMPFYSLLMIGFHWLTGDWVIAGQLISFLALTLIVIPVYWLVEEIFGSSYSFYSALFAACSPAFRFDSVIIIRDPLFMFLFAVFLLFCFRGYSRNSWKYFGWALLFALFAAFTRVEGSLVFIAYLLLFSYRLLCRASPRWRLVLLGLFLAATAGLVGLLYASPTLAKSLRTGKITEVFCDPIAFYHRMAVHHVFNKLKEVEDSVPGGSFGGNAIETARNYLPVIYLLSLIHALIEDTFPSMFLLALIGIVTCFTWRDWRHRYLMLWMLFLVAIPYLYAFRVNYLSGRYTWGGVYILYCWTGVGFGYLGRLMTERFALNRRWSLLLLLLLLILPCAKIIRHHRGRETNIEDAGKWLRTLAPSSKEPILTNDPRILLFADIRYKLDDNRFVIQTNELPEMLSEARKLHAGIVVWTTKTKPQPPPGKELACFPGIKKIIVIYRLNEKK